MWFSLFNKVHIWAVWLKMSANVVIGLAVTTFFMFEGH